MIEVRAFLAVVVFLLSFGTFAQGQSPAVNGKIPWRLTVVVMDGTSLVNRAQVPVSEAVRFIESRSRFKFDVRYVVDPIRHTYTPYYFGSDRNRDGKGDDVRYVM